MKIFPAINEGKIGFLPQLMDADTWTVSQSSWDNMGYQKFVTEI